MLLRPAVAAVVCALSSCTSAPPPAGPPPPDPPAASIDTPAGSFTPGGQPGVPAASEDPGGSPDVATVFPPPNFSAPVERTAKEGDGQWTPLALAGGEPPVLWTTVVHPDTIKKFVVVAIVAIDRQRVGLHLVAGTEEPESSEVAPAERPGLVRKDHLPGLIAAMNGGFKTRHGGHGMKLGGARFGTPNDGSCTIAAYNDGTMRIGSWPSLASTEGAMEWYRQTPPCLIEDGEIHPLLQSDTNTKKWGSSEKGETEIRRSAMGVSADGRTLYFAIGDWTTAQALTRGLKLAGAHALAELDINYSFTRFTLYEHKADGSLKASSPLLSELKFTQKGYIESPAHRDFFYLRHLP